MKRLLLLFALFGCTDRSPDVIPIQYEFYSDFPTASHNVNFTFSEDMPIVHDPGTHMDRLAHGYSPAPCHGDDNTIVLNSKWWDQESNPYYKRIVVYHELSHCIFGLQHPTDPYEYTIMNSILTTVKEDGSNWRELVDELKKRSMRRVE